MNLHKLRWYSDGLRDGWPGFHSRQGQNFSLLRSVQTGSAAHSVYLMSTDGSFPGVKRPGREAIHLHLMQRS
jgi:hypothetical protein